MRGRPWSERLPLPLSVAAIILACVGVTPPGQAASSAVKRVFANDSGAVDGLSAARQPKPGRLLALDRRGRFPARALPAVQGPRGPQGAQGPRGARGTAGAPGGELAFTVNRARDHERGANEPATMARLQGLPAANWLVIGTGWSGRTYLGVADFDCAIRSGERVEAGSVASAGRGPGGMRFNPHLAVALVARPHAGQLEWSCAKTTEGDDIAAHLEEISLIALRVGRIEVREASR